MPLIIVNEVSVGRRNQPFVLSSADSFMSMRTWGSDWSMDIDVCLRSLIILIHLVFCLVETRTWGPLTKTPIPLLKSDFCISYILIINDMSIFDDQVVQLESSCFGKLGDSTVVLVVLSINPLRWSSPSILSISHPRGYSSSVLFISTLHRSSSLVLVIPPCWSLHWSASLVLSSVHLIVLFVSPVGKLTSLVFYLVETRTWGPLTKTLIPLL